MKISYNSEELIQEVLSDIEDLGKSFKVFAIYDERFIKEYIDCDIPTREEFEDVGTEQEFQRAVFEYKADLEKLKGKKYEAMTLQELFFKLQKQNDIF